MMIGEMLVGDAAIRSTDRSWCFTPRLKQFSRNLEGLVDIVEVAKAVAAVVADLVAEVVDSAPHRQQQAELPSVSTPISAPIQNVERSAA
jgi:hypothetical protein